MDVVTELTPDVDAGGQVPPPLKRFVKMADFCVDTRMGTVFKHGKRIPLSPKCCYISLFLASRHTTL